MQIDATGHSSSSATGWPLMRCVIICLSELGAQDRLYGGVLPGDPALQTSKGTAVKLTVDSSEPLEDAMRVLGALYGVTLIVSNADGETNAPSKTNIAARSESTATRNPGSAKKRTSRAASTRAKRSAVRPAAGSPSPSNAEIRTWARQNGFTVSDRGRLPASVLTAFQRS